MRLTGRNDSGVRYFGEGELKNISSRGAFIYTDRSSHVGDRLDIAIRLPIKAENWLVYSAQVVRVDFDNPRAGVAIRFDSSWPSFTDR